MARKKKEDQAEFQARVAPLRSRGIEEQSVVPEAWDLLSDIINLADEAGNTRLHKIAQDLMEKEFFLSSKPYHSKIEFLYQLLEGVFKGKIKRVGSSGGYEDLDYVHDAILTMITEDTKGKVITEYDFEDEIKEKAMLIANRVFKDVYKKSSNKELATGVTKDVIDLPVTFTSGKDFGVLIDAYKKRLTDQRQQNQQSVQKSGPVRTLTEEEKRIYKPETVDEKKAEIFLKAVEKGQTIKNKKRRKEG